MRLSALTILAAAAALVCAAPAPAQTIEELTVTGHPNASRLQSLSERVSYADLDLNSAFDRERLRLRVNSAARRVCTYLNQESPNRANMGHSCQDVAIRDALGQVRVAVADARDHAYAEAFGDVASAEIADPNYAPPPFEPR